MQVCSVASGCVILATFVAVPILLWSWNAECTNEQNSPWVCGCRMGVAMATVSDCAHIRACIPPVQELWLTANEACNPLLREWFASTTENDSGVLSVP